jgi:hypothetical protein
MTMTTTTQTTTRPTYRHPTDVWADFNALCRAAGVPTVAKRDELFEVLRDLGYYWNGPLAHNVTPAALEAALPALVAKRRQHADDLAAGRLVRLTGGWNSNGVGGLKNPATGEYFDFGWNYGGALPTGSTIRELGGETVHHRPDNGSRHGVPVSYDAPLWNAMTIDLPATSLPALRDYCAQCSRWVEEVRPGTSYAAYWEAYRAAHPVSNT